MPHQYFIRTLFCILLMLGEHLIFAQKLYTRNISITNGLPSNAIRDIFKDSRGIMWFGTESGLCRYDGINLKTYTKDDGLAGNRVQSITEDASGNLWMACYGSGISMFDGQTFKNFSEQQGLVNNNVGKIEYSKKHKGLMIGTVNGFSFLKDSTFTSFQDPSKTTRDLLQVTSFIDVDTLIYLITYYDATQFITFNPHQKTFKYLPKNHRFHHLSPTSTCAFVTSDKDTLIGNYIIGIKQYKKDTYLTNTKVGQVFDIVEDKNGDQWFASWNDGMQLERKNKGGIYKFRDGKETYYNDKLGINTQQCWSLYFDKDEYVLWIGTLDQGIYLYPMSGIEHTPASDLNSRIPEINDVFSDTRKDIWLTVGDKIFIKKSPKNTGPSCAEFIQQPTNNIGSLFKINENPNGNLWIGSNIGLCELVGTSLKPKMNMLRDVPYNFFTKDSFANVLVFYEMYRYSLKTFELQEILKLRKNATWSSVVNHLKVGDNDWLYSISDGITLFKNNTLTRFSYLENQIDIEFKAMCTDFNNHLIAGTNTGKVYFLKYENDSMVVKHQISQIDGLIGTEIGWMQVDHKNRLWISTNRGLNVLDINQLMYDGKKTITYFNEENGYFDYTSKEGIVDSDGNLIVISRKNMFRINPDHLIQSTSKPLNLVLDQVDINFKKMDWNEANKVNNWVNAPLNKIILAHDMNTLTFHYHLLQYAEPAKSKYSYLLEGGNVDWSPYASETKIVLTELPPKNYKLKIRGILLSNPNQVSELTIAFCILPPWYKTWWFYTLLALALITLVFAAFKLKINSIKKKTRIDIRMSELKLESLISQMNPHFIFNVFNSLQLFILQNDTKGALDHMGKFANLIRKVLNNSTKIKISLYEEINFLESYLILEQRRVENLSYSIICDKNIDREHTFIPPMLLQPLIENTIMHGLSNLEGNRQVTVKFAKANENQHRCTIEDNGIGRDKSKELNHLLRGNHESKGTKIIEERLKLLNKSNDIQLIYSNLYKHNKVGGTKVEILF
jgi:ligand-binding sensor domain-containing protein